MFILLLTPTTSRGCLGGDSNPMHLSDLSLQRFCHKLVLFNKAHPSKVWGLDEYLQRKVCVNDKSLHMIRETPLTKKKSPVSVMFQFTSYLIHAATASTDVDHGDVGGVGEGLGQGRDYDLLAGAWGA